MSLVYLYSPSNESSPNEPIWVAIEIASTISSLHRWETCLITWPLTHGSQPKVSQINLTDIQLTENPPIISRYFAFNYTATNETQAVLYWYESATFTINSTAQQKQVKISLITYPESTEELPKIENQLVTLATAITSYWQPVKTWSQVTLIMSQNGAKLAATTSALLIVVVTLYFFEKRQQRKANTSAYRKLSQPVQEIIDAVQKTETKMPPTLSNITATYKRTTKQSTDEEQLLTKLSEIEKTGLVTTHVANEQDEPTQVWKTQIS
jgi:hypothetical protein